MRLKDMLNGLDHIWVLVFLFVIVLVVWGITRGEFLEKLLIGLVGAITTAAITTKNNTVSIEGSQTRSPPEPPALDTP